MKNENLSPEILNALAMSDDLLANLQDINSVLTTAETAPIFQTHFVDLSKEIAGQKDLIIDILKEHGAIAEMTDSREKQISVGLYTYQILKQVEIRFTKGTTRYPVASVRNCLSTHMKADNRLGKIQLTNDEDSARECNKPQKKWFAVASVINATTAIK